MRKSNEQMRSSAVMVVQLFLLTHQVLTLMYRCTVWDRLLAKC